MNAKEYLNQIRDLDKEINAKLEQCDQLRAMATRTSSSLSAEWVSGGKQTNSRMSDCVVRFVDLEREINRDIDRLVDLKREAIKKINTIKNRNYRLLLFNRYINCKSWEEITVEMGYSEESISWIHKMHGQALAQLDIERHTTSVI